MKLLDDAAAAGFIVSTETKAWSRYNAARQMTLETFTNRSADWSVTAKNMGLMPIEHLVPLIKIPLDSELPASMALADEAFSSRREAMPSPDKARWGYYFYLGGGLSTLGAEASLDGASRLSKRRSLHRLRVIGKAVPLLCDGSLSGLSVLDMACNWGAFSVEMAARGAGHVHGCDLRADNIDKASNLSRYLGLNTCSFSVENVYDLAEDRQYDIVLNLGLLYHVTRQYELVQKTFNLCRRAAIIETITHREPFSGFVLGWHKDRAEHSAGEITAELHPTYRALIDMMFMVGFRAVVELDGEPDPEWTTFETDPFGKKERRFLVGIR